MTDRPAEIFAAAEKSLAAAGRGDRGDWVGLFTPDGRVEDPVGSQPHIGRDRIGAFFDTFIGPRQISYRSNADIVTASTVLRDLTLDVRMGAGVAMAIPAFLRYRVDATTDELRIAELQAFWELPPMILQFGRHGLAAAGPGLGLARALLKNQGLGGAAGFLRGFRRVGTPARRVLDVVLGAVASGDEVTTRRLLGGATVTRGDDEPVGVDQLAGRLRGTHAAKRIAAGRSIAVAIVGGEGPTVLIADFGPDQAISRLRYFAS